MWPNYSGTELVGFLKGCVAPGSIPRAQSAAGYEGQAALGTRMLTAPFGPIYFILRTPFQTYP